MPKKQDVIVGTVFYGLALFWATVFSVTMWRLNALGGPHWLKLSYVALIAVWVPVTTILLVFVRKSDLIGRDWGYRLFIGSFWAFCAVCLAFIGLGITDYVCG